MVTAAHRSTPEPPHPGFPSFQTAEAHDEITSQLASRIGELYASEEMRQRVERTDRMIQRASGPIEE